VTFWSGPLFQERLQGGRRSTPSSRRSCPPRRDPGRPSSGTRCSRARPASSRARGQTPLSSRRSGLRSGVWRIT
jgi:hypothetical protein